MKEERLLTTGQAAKRCSVTADTILKWIRSGYLPAQRTAGGHHRIAETDLKLVSGFRKPVNPLSSREMHDLPCAAETDGPDLLKRCPAHLLGLRRREQVSIAGAAAWEIRPRSSERCHVCGYFREVSQYGMNVLILTRDPIMSLHLKETAREATFHLEITNSEYRCSVLVGECKPDFVVIDSAIGREKCREIGLQILNDPRNPFVEVLVAGTPGGMPDECTSGVFGRLQRPFDYQDIGERISRIWYARITKQEGGGSKESSRDYRPVL